MVRLVEAYKNSAQGQTVTVPARVPPMCDRIDPTFATLWGILRSHGYVWHRTTLPSFEAIMRDEQIVPNSGQFPEVFGQSRVSYAWHLNAVSLFDFDTSDEAYIFEHEFKWGSVLTKRFPAGVLIGMRRDALDPGRLLLPADILANDARLDVLPEKIRRGRMVIPAVEALHIGPIPVRTFSRFLLTAFDDEGEIRICERAPGGDVCGEFSEVSAAWNAEHQRLVDERHARGEYSLAERLTEASGRIIE